jgi:S-adenosylmethionine decarboxylase
MKTESQHILVDLYDCQADLNEPIWLSKRAVEAVELAGGTVLRVWAEPYFPQGASVLVMVAESHLSIHTWPEHQFAAIDFFTCGKVKPEVAIGYLMDKLKPGASFPLRVERGSGSGPLTTESFGGTFD